MCWMIFGLTGVLLFLIPGVSDLSLWFVNKYNFIGLILIIILALLYSMILMIGTYYSSLIINDKKGMAIFLKDYVEIIMGEKHRIINFIETIKMKHYPLVFARGIGLGGYKFELKTKDINLKIRSSLMELWKERTKDFSLKKIFEINWKEYHSTLEDLYNEIELNIALKNE